MRSSLGLFPTSTTVHKRSKVTPKVTLIHISAWLPEWEPGGNMRVFYNGKDDSDEYIRRPLFVVNTLVTFWSIDLDLVIYNMFTLKTLY